MLEIGMTHTRAMLFTTLAIALAIPATNAEAGYRRKPRTTTSNTAPLISGTPSTTVQATTAYAFTPMASDAQNNRLTFYISNKPAWASFSSSTGKLYGTPASTQVGTYSNIGIKVSDGQLTSSLPAFSVTVTNAPTSTATISTNSAPTISGTPATSVTAGNPYSFTPKAADADGNLLAFSVSNKPAWAIFSTATGSLSGTPTTLQSGTYSGVSISVSDGSATSALPAFSISVNAPPPAITGSAALSWTAPTQNTDGSSLTDLAGYKVYHGTSSTSLSDVMWVAGSSATTYTYTALAAGTHYFAVSAYSSTGTESGLSSLGTKTIQ
jgi:hypothetical protein